MAEAAVKTGLSPQEYLALERASEVKHEYAGGEIFVMAGGTVEHSLIASNLGGELRAALRKSPCRVLTADMRVKVAVAERYFYPDVTVVCEAPRFEDEHRDSLLNPAAVFEVLSDSTESYDRGEKFAQYRKLSTLTDYVLISQKEVLVEHFGRRTDGTWLLTVLGPGGTLRLPSVGCEIAVDEIYFKVIDAPAETAPAAAELGTAGVEPPAS